MKILSRLSRALRICFEWSLRGALGTICACTLLPSPDVSVKTLRSGSLAVDSTGVVFEVRPGIRGDSHPTLCMNLDTLYYVVLPRAEAFHSLPLTDTTVYARNAARQPIALRAVLESSNGEQVVSTGGGYSPGNGMDTPDNQRHLTGPGGVAVCLVWNSLRPAVRYGTVRLQSTRPVIVHDLSLHYLSRT